MNGTSMRSNGQGTGTKHGQRTGCARSSASARAFTLVDLAITLAAIAILVAAIIPALARLRRNAGEALSMANLEALSSAHAMYAFDWNDRQVTWIPDDAGVYVTLQGGTNWYTAYIAALGGSGCPQQLLLGWDDDPNATLWAYYLSCLGFPGTPANYVVYTPMVFTGSVFGSFRLPNALALHNYVDGRFYGEAFYAPGDTKTLELAQPLIDGVDGSFGQPPPYGTGGLPGIVYSSYCLSPAAMYDPQVLSYNASTGGWWKNPVTFFTSYQSPTVPKCMYPELKTRMIEHNWNAGQPAAVNPAFAGGLTPYYFNHGIDAAPVTLFFDGHVASLSNAQVVADDAKVLAAMEGAVGLWTRGTPLGTMGYFGAQSYDGMLVSHHVLTADGILGRDVLGTGPLADGGGAKQPSRETSRALKPSISRRPIKATRPPGVDPQGLPTQ